MGTRINMEKKTTKTDSPQKKTPQPDSATSKTVTKKTVKKLNLPKGKYIHTVGRRKSAVATVHLFNEKGDVTVDNKNINDYFTYKSDVDLIMEVLKTVGAVGKYKINIKVKGGGKRGQVGAVCLAIARALIKLDPELRKTLKSKGFLTRDPRVKERKKPGLKRARKAPQWSKR